MRISVVIPTYNSEAFIQATLESVFRQTISPAEIIILDDGSTDKTISILNSYKPLIKVIGQDNKGVANARNILCERAQGDLVAFLDHDDIWHPTYLELQQKRYEEYPQAVAFFTNHLIFHGYGNYHWENGFSLIQRDTHLIAPQDFITRYNLSNGTFYTMSVCCVPKKVLISLGREPFCEKVNGVDDCYLCNLLPLLGPVVHSELTAVAYRITKEAQSVNHLKNFELVVKVFELLENRYRETDKKNLLIPFELSYASKRRTYGKTLMGAGNIIKARCQFKKSLNNSHHVTSMAKSLFLLFLTYMPSLLQIKWPKSHRVEGVK